MTLEPGIECLGCEPGQRPCTRHLSTVIAPNPLQMQAHAGCLSIRPSVSGNCPSGIEWTAGTAGSRLRRIESHLQRFRDTVL